MRAPSILPTLAISIGLLLSGPAAADASPAPAPQPSDQVSPSAPPAPSASPLPAMTGTTPAVPPIEQSPSGPAVPPTGPPTDAPPPVEDVIATAPGTSDPEPAVETPSTGPEPAPDASSVPPTSDAPTPPSSPAAEATPEETDPAVEADETPVLPGDGQRPGAGEAVVVDRSAPRAPQPVPAGNGAAPSRVPTPVEEVRIDKVEQAEQAEGFQPPVEGTSLRYTVAGILSIVALLLALAIAFVAHPRRPRGTH
ncbi:hypothetical protein [Arthrobacter sp. SX1312]|uniref:hypothetical protein n=1 Tax=Arthrobacter sp. SX1312 TaxID=2058896 RepID=UPI000CE455A4|nr:hypothetical protein [Arthrobacter sp. SX1312]